MNEIKEYTEKVFEDIKHIDDHFAVQRKMNDIGSKRII